MRKKIVYIAHPIGGDIQANLADLYRILRILNTDELEVFGDIVPFAPYAMTGLDDNVALERKIAMNNNEALINTGVFDELWLTGDKISLGMREEIKLFRSLGKTIVDYTGKI